MNLEELKAELEQMANPQQDATRKGARTLAAILIKPDNEKVTLLFNTTEEALKQYEQWKADYPTCFRGIRDSWNKVNRIHFSKQDSSTKR